MLKESAKRNYIAKSDRILEFFNIETLIPDFYFDNPKEFTEHIVSDKFKTEESIHKTIKNQLYQGTLTEEINRIYAKFNEDNIRGHAITYKLLYNSTKFRDLEVELLISALYNNNRLKSRRYVLIEESKDYMLRNDSFLNSMSGGTVVINYTNDVDSDESNFFDVFSPEDTFTTLSKTLKKYKKEVLFIFCVKYSNNKVESLIDKVIGSTTKIINVSSEILSSSDAVKYLKALAMKDNLTTNNELLKLINNKNLYNIHELNLMYSNWFDETFINFVYTQYKFLSDKSKKCTALDELNSLIGLSEVKNIVKQIINYSRLQKLFVAKGISSSPRSMNMVFYGSPGTAKTTVARLLAKILKEENVLNKGHLVECGRSDLVGKYLGWTAPTVKDKFNEAEGGILFIDEAYSLLEEKDGLYGDEAINTIVQEMENRRNSVIVIFAGYENKMKQFVDRNPGLRSRIKFHVQFSDYTPAELYDILELFTEEYHRHLDEDVRNKLIPHFSQIIKIPNFGNGRYVRNLIENAEIKQASRLMEANCNNLTSYDIQLLKAEDFDVKDIRMI